MAKRATARAEGGTGKKAGKKTRSTSSAGSGSRSSGARSSGSRSRTRKSDPVDALVKLLQSPLVIDLLAVGATAALAAITEKRTSGSQKSGRSVKAAGKAAAAAIGRRLASEFEEIRNSSRKSRQSGKSKARGTE